MTKQSIGAVILAAGFSSRMGAFKPLLPFGSETALERVIRAFVAAQVSPVLVVVGHRRCELHAVIRKTPALAIFNPDFRQGMFSSIKAGLRALPIDIEAFFVHPVDIPLLNHTVVNRLRQAYRDHPEQSILYPCYQGNPGRPPLIPADLLTTILQAQDRGGLRAVLAAFPERILQVEVDDPGILWDMDVAADYQRLLRLRPKT